jgi:hypothetical protein
VGATGRIDRGVEEGERWYEGSGMDRGVDVGMMARCRPMAER